MAKMTITEALAETKTIDKRIAKAHRWTSMADPITSWVTFSISSDKGANCFNELMFTHQPLEFSSKKTKALRAL